MRRSESENLPTSVLGRVSLVLKSCADRDADLSLTDIVDSTGLPKATVHRLLRDLVGLGLLERHNQRYQLGLRMFEMGQGVLQTRALREKAVPLLADLRHATQSTVHLVILDKTEVVYLEKIIGPRGPRIPSRAGGRMPAHCTGVGKAILAYSPPEVVKALVEGGLSRRTARTIVVPSMLMRELTAIRKSGIAFEREESAVGVSCVAAPVLDTNGRPIAAISAAGFGNSLETGRIAPTVRAAALSLSRQLSVLG